MKFCLFTCSIITWCDNYIWNEWVILIFIKTSCKSISNIYKILTYEGQGVYRYGQENITMLWTILAFFWKRLRFQEACTFQTQFLTIKALCENRYK